jgi:hypothetical protein
MTLKFKQKIDIVIILVLLILIGGRIFYVHSDINIGYVELSTATLSCEKNRKYDKFSGYFTIDNDRYSSSKNYDSCETFKAIMNGKKINGYFMKGSGRLVEIIVDNKPYYERSYLSQLFYSIFGALIIWSFSRYVIFIVVRKYA